MLRSTHTKKRLLEIAMIITAVLFIVLLFVVNLTTYDGYSYDHCERPQLNLAQTVSAHEAVTSNSPDRQRINDVQTVNHAISDYRTEYGHIPDVQTWIELEQLLVPEYMTVFPQDPCVHKGFSEYQYEYHISEDKHEYLIKTLLSDTSDRYVAAQFDQDVDGEVIGIWCGEGKYDREFCMTTHNH